MKDSRKFCEESFPGSASRRQDHGRNTSKVSRLLSKIRKCLLHLVLNSPKKNQRKLEQICSCGVSLL